MAARLRKTHQEDVRAKIQASQLVNRLQDHALGKNKDLTELQFKCARVLLDKALPSLSQVDSKLAANITGRVETITRRIIRPE